MKCDKITEAVLELRENGVNITALADDLSTLSNSEVIERLDGCLGTLRSIATSRVDQVDAEILSAEQALRRALKLLKSILAK